MSAAGNGSLYSEPAGDMTRPHPLGDRENVPLAPFTNLGIGGPARYYAEARTESQILAALEFAERRKLPVFILAAAATSSCPIRAFPPSSSGSALRGLRQTGPAHPLRRP